jgi:hypothetical protein
MSARHDVSRTLGDLEARLARLERELAGAAAPAPASPPGTGRAPEPPPSTPPAPPPLDPARVDALGARIGELLRVRDELRRSADALAAEYARLTAAPPPAAAPYLGPPYPTAPTPPPYAPPPAPAPPYAPPPAAAPPYAPPPPLAPEPGETIIEAAPFADMATLSVLEQSLRRLPAVLGVRVRRVEDGRATIAVRLAAPIALADELRAVLPLDAQVTSEVPGRLVLHVRA